MVSNLPPLLKNKTCAITGHRILLDDIKYQKVKADLLEIYNKGYSVFLVGMAIGFDLLCFEALQDLKADGNDIKVCAVIPCEGQEKYYSSEEKEKYLRFVSLADYVAKEERTYFRGCMLKRNDYMLDNCSYLYAYFKGSEKGGTLYTVNGAKKRNITVLYYGEQE